MGRFDEIKKRFFNKITFGCNPSKVTFKIYEVTHGDSLSAFLGDGDREEKETFTLPCFYQRYLNDKQREKAGVNEEVKVSLFISPISLKPIFKSEEFPQHVRDSYSNISVELFGVHYEVESIRDLEPIQDFGEVTRVAYQINLKSL